MFIDTHCHLTFEQYNDDRAMVIGNAKKAAVKQMICPGVDNLSSRLAVKIAEKNPGVVYAAVGFHPYEASHTHDLNIIERLIKENNGSRRDVGMTTKPIVAIGECGLDYHLFKGEVAAGKKQEQRMLFEEQLQLAVKYKLPVIMHVRDAYEDFFTVIDAQPTPPRGVIHCFSGGLQEMREAQTRKFYVGIDGNVTYSKQLGLIVPKIPLSMIVLETDSPYLTPVPHRGDRNEPKHIPLIAKETARLLSTSIDEVSLQTTKNAQDLFLTPVI
jgi:TatD DNase family protein